MRFAGILPEDAPDPRRRRLAQLAEMPVPLIGLVEQPSLEDANTLSVTTARDNSGYTEFTVGVTYTLWRNPADPTDPRNLADLPDDIRESIDAVPPWPRPRWLIDQVERMRYPQLWDAVRTTWRRDASERVSLASLLAAHVAQVANLMDQHAPAERDTVERPSASEPPMPVDGSPEAIRLDGVPVAATASDIDRRLLAIGFQTGPSSFVTAVLPRAELSYLRVAFATRRGPVLPG